ncbi:lipocalin family protein [Chitinophagaceae bacterium LB-8]|uniref:Lipocalin family protein n=1 Tax=Paraflavisolibacter caeni TaxID=2982496 RepID=A0A9X2XUV9_9BACT|nr:lipocalin family protein [Paraflavisolibacter caeni]MCU7548952.1 lipocalin family protein [Paraflavisolibacter caeni]
MIKHLLTICSLLLLVSSCNKDDDNNNDPSAITKENLAGSYMLVSATGKVNGIDIDITSYPTILPACKKDDILTLKTDNTFVSTDAGTKCSPDGSDNGTWSLPNSSTITIKDQTLNIISFDGTNLRVGYKQNAPLLGQVDVTATFKKQ